MNKFLNSLFRLVGIAPRRHLEELAGENRRARAALDAARQGGARPGWQGVASSRDEDAGNKEHMTDLSATLQRNQDLDVNNPDLGGFHRTRTAQIVGAHVRFKCVPRSDEVGVEVNALAKIATKIDRIRHLHSKIGEFDSTGNRRSEGEQQERTVLTALIHGTCIIHRVWRPENKLVPLSIELIPGVRISTPIDRQGDPKISYGIEYADSSRTRVVAYHVRKVSQTRGDTFIPTWQWDRLPIEDCSAFSIVESAGLDRSLPLAIRCIRMLRNRGEFIEAAVESARAQAKYTAFVECADGQDPYETAFNDADQNDATGTVPVGFVTTGNMQTLYLQKGEKVVPNSAKLPDPDFSGFMDATDSRMSRGLVSSLSRFTRKVTSSWAGGRMEDQQDDPIIDQYRRTFKAAWQKINDWYIEALWLTDAVEMPGYSAETSVFWSEFRAEFPGKLHINPTDTQNAREKGYMQRTLTPQQGCEEDGKDLDDNLEQWAVAIKKARAKEIEHGLEEGSLDYLVSVMPSSASEKTPEPEPNEPPPQNNSRRLFNNSGARQ